MEGEEEGKDVLRTTDMDERPDAERVVGEVAHGDGETVRGLLSS